MNLQRKIKNALPSRLVQWIGTANFIFQKNLYRIYRRPVRPAETSKAKDRRIREGFFERYCRGDGLDIGYGGDLLCSNCRGWDIEHGDAQTLASLPNNQFDFVYSSHCLEHVDDPADALKNWWRVVKQGGYLILYLPERDLYERKTTLPSRWNTSHRRFFLLDRDELPDTLGMLPLIKRTLDGYEIVKAEVCKQNYNLVKDTVQATGEYSIEVILRKS
jgi:SAM-dependent methyltransferase